MYESEHDVVEQLVHELASERLAGEMAEWAATAFSYLVAKLGSFEKALGFMLEEGAAYKAIADAQDIGA